MYFVDLVFGRAPSPVNPTATLNEYSHTTKELLLRAVDCQNWEYILNVVTLFPNQACILETLKSLAHSSKADDLVTILNSAYADKADPILLDMFFWHVATNDWQVLNKILATRAAQQITTITLEKALYSITQYDHEPEGVNCIFDHPEASKISAEKWQEGFFNIIRSAETELLSYYLQFTLVKSSLNDQTIAEAYGLAISEGHHETAQILREYASMSIPLDFPDHVLVDAARHNDLMSVRHLVNHYELTHLHIVKAIVEAAQHKHEKVLLFLFTRISLEQISERQQVYLVKAFWEAILAQAPTVVLIFKAFKVTSFINESLIEEISPLLETCNKPTLRHYKPLALENIAFCRTLLNVMVGV